ncbi:hypothetical protein ACFLW7_02085 [Chloroflexota bacterium]
MHRIFRKALDNATGVSEFVIVVIIDIRGFSVFSQARESPETAMFIKRVYMKLIDSYFDFASFYKPTGDGLLFIIRFDESTLKEMAQKTVAGCMACHAEFGNICDDDPMIYFKVPNKIGIGVARGTACCLVSGDVTIDYSGQLLNLTSRLTGLARPSGIVIHGNFGIDILDESMRSSFQDQDVYLDGIAEHKPIRIYFTKESTIIPKRNREPIVAEKWRHKKDVKPFRDILRCTQWFRYYLESEPASAEDIKVTVKYPSVVDGKTEEDYEIGITFQDFKYEREAGKSCIRLNFPKLSKRLQADSVGEDMDIHIDIAYVER